MIPLLYDTIIVLGPADRPPSGDIGVQVMQHTKIRAWYTSPPPIEQMLLLPEGPELASTLDFVIFSGGPMSPSSGDHLSTFCDIGQYIGSTEIGIIPCILPNRDTWNYFEWHPTIECEMQHVAEDIYELIIPYKKDLRWIRPDPERAFEPYFKQNRETGEWRTKDLFRQHPKKPKSWRFYVGVLI
jgi:acyl-coenzyme A synthetase/AMP-(fatty) acid ligase